MSRKLLFEAIENRDEKKVYQLIHAEGVDVDVAEATSQFAEWTPLCAAAKRGTANIASILIDAGANIDGVYNFRGCGIPLHIAIEHNSITVVRLLIDRGANLSYTNEHGMPALHHAAAAPGDCVEIVAMLLEAGAEINNRSSGEDHSTALCFAIEKRNIDVVRLLIATTDCETDARDLFGSTTLMFAVWIFDDEAIYDNDCSEIIRALIYTGAEVDAQDNDGDTALHNACQGRNEDIIRFLLACGANPNVYNRHGITPIEMRIKKLNIACLLVAAGAKRRASRAIIAKHRDIIDASARAINRERVDLIRWRAYEICVALQDVELPAPQIIRILEFACEPFSNCVKYHNFWDIAVCVKHFKERQKISSNDE